MLSIAPIPYLENGIPGFLSKHQLNVHVTKHHQAYVNKANSMLPGTEFEGKTVEEIIKAATGDLFNQVAQHFNHSFFWECLTDKQGEMPAATRAFLEKHFTSVDAFRKEFTAKASTLFGSGWVYLAKNADGSVTINQYSNAMNPIKENGFPILCADTWEHAWYIDYENRKAEYLDNFWNAVNWDFVNSRIQQL